MSVVKGPFEVKATPFPPYDTSGGVTLSRMTFSKTFRGALEATSTVEMLAAMTSVKGSASYVAIEKLSGSVDGKKGTFVMQHNAVMNRDVPSLSITIVPDSGTEELAGITGSMKIDIEPGGKHFYTFDYKL
jgi:hypothetical protein